MEALKAVAAVCPGQASRCGLLPGRDDAGDHGGGAGPRWGRASADGYPLGGGDRLYRAGRLSLFIGETALTFLDDVMWARAFSTPSRWPAPSSLSTNDLIWSRLEREYLLGQREPLNDLMAWNADGTRLPYRMHSEYLRKLFLHNDLAEDRYTVARCPISLRDIRVPILAVGTTRDHVAPWQSVYKLHRLTDTDLTFVLTSGGHNAGIVSEPGHLRRSYQAATRRKGDRFIDPQTWQATTAKTEGSWWPAWQAWLLEHSTGPAPAPSMGCPAKGYLPLGDAPGTYVLEK